MSPPTPHVLTQGAHEIPPPKPHHSNKSRYFLPVPRRVIRANPTPPPMRDRDQRAARARLERNLDLGLFIQREVLGAPLEDDAPRRVPSRDPPGIENARPRSGLERFEQPPSHARLDA